MSEVSPRKVMRFLHLVRPDAEVWQGGIFTLPIWDQKPDRPQRLCAAFWYSARLDRVNAEPVNERDATDERAIAALLNFGLDRSMARCRPAVIEVVSPDLARAIETTLHDRELTIRIREKLPAVTALLDNLLDTLEPGRVRGALTAAGVTLQAMRAFAEAARLFYLAAPWRYFAGEDLIRIASPAMKGTDLAVVMGAHGQEYGVMFLSSEKEYHAIMAGRPVPPRLRGFWGVSFEPISKLPPDDVLLWERNGLPVASDNAYPMAAFLPTRGRGSVKRPDAGMLAHFEGLLRVLAAMTEEQLDAGRWTMDVRTHQGVRQYALELPVWMTE